MTIKQFIEKAIAGGWNGLEWNENVRVEQPVKITSWVWADSKEGESNGIPLAWALLNPLAWQAVGKVEGWGSFYDTEGMPRNYDTQGWYPITKTGSGYDEQMWQAYMHRMIDALAEGKTLEQFLETL